MQERDADSQCTHSKRWNLVSLLTKHLEWPIYISQTLSYVTGLIGRKQTEFHFGTKQYTKEKQFLGQLSLKLL